MTTIQITLTILHLLLCAGFALWLIWKVVPILIRAAATFDRLRFDGCGYRITCGWCSKHISGDFQEIANTSHGICPECAKTFAPTSL